jgi:ribosomal protein L1
MLNKNLTYSTEIAVKMIKENSKERKFKESIEAIIRLNVDPK